MRTEQVVVVPYDPSWVARFEDVACELREALGDRALGIEHVGSTSVPGLSAKPILDIDVVIASNDELEEAIDRLAQVGYIYEGDLGIADRYAFRYNGKPHLMTHHLYICPQTSAELARHIAFREYLKNHPEDVSAYSQVKREAAERFPNDIDAYIAWKSPCIEQIYAKMDKEKST